MISSKSLISLILNIKFLTVIFVSLWLISWKIQPFVSYQQPVTCMQHVFYEDKVQIRINTCLLDK